MHSLASGHTLSNGHTVEDIARQVLTQRLNFAELPEQE
jgi:hypothetical protein